MKLPALKSHIAYVLLLLVWGATCTAGPVLAQDIAVNWSPPANLSNTPTSSNHPAIAADAAGNVHVVWAEDIGGKSILGIPRQMNVSGNGLVYMHWGGLSWSKPIDIIASGDGLAEYPSLAADAQGFLHLVWTGMSVIYYSRAPASEAASARAWSTPLVLGSSARTAFESAVAVDKLGTIHILYANRDINPAVIYVRIVDNGLGSRTSTRLSPSLEPPDEAAFLEVSLKIDPRGRIHALWGTVRSNGFGHAIYYARSLDAGQTWSKAARLAQGEKDKANAEWPSLGIVGDSELHLLYCYPANMARQERVSLDAGETWGEPHTIYSDLEGIAGSNVQVTDAAGNLHVLSNMRTHDQIGGLIYWRWLGDQWSAWQWANIETASTGPGGHWTAATIRLGNEIHALWNTNFSSQAGEVWHVSGVIPGLAAQTPAPLSSPRALPQASARASPLKPSPSEVAKQQPSPTAPGEQVSEGPGTLLDYEPARASDLGYTLLVGVAPALLLVLVVAAWRLLRKR